MELSTITVMASVIDISAEYVAQSQSLQAVKSQAYVSSFRDMRVHTNASSYV